MSVRPSSAALPAPSAACHRHRRLSAVPRSACLPVCVSRPLSRWHCGLILATTLSRTAHVSVAALRGPLAHSYCPPSRATRPPGTFNRHGALFCCSAVCYSRCPRRESRKSARSRLSCRPTSATTHRQRLSRIPRKILTCRSARLEEITAALSVHFIRRTHAAIFCIRETCILLN